MTSEKLPHLGKPQVQQLNEKYGYFKYRDAQGDVSAAFANEAVAEYLRVNEEAQAVMAECGLSPRELQERCSVMEAALQHCEQMLMKYAIDRVDHEAIEDEALEIIRAALAKHKEV
ncbi:MAG: hypothetical protein ACN6O1_10365 [Comamonas sp.]|uniref:hypothetical protein n=1 Tax=Comamonas sp. TaxID=34028 RepID=UPI003D117702